MDDEKKKNIAENVSEAELEKMADALLDDELIEEKNLTTDLIQVSINELVNNSDKYNELKNNLEKLSTKESSTIIYESIKEMLKWKIMGK